MELLEAAQDGVTVVHIVGRVNSGNAQDIGARLQAIFDRGGRAIVIDLSRLDHMTSNGFRALLLADKQAIEMGATVVLCGLHGLTQELFEIGGFVDMFVIASTREDAMRRAAAHSAQA